MYDVIAVGSAILDVYLQSREFVKKEMEEFEAGVGMCIAYGGKAEVDDVELTTGGGGTNNAVAFARKGFKTGIICELGKDVLAWVILHELEEEGVDLSLVVQEQSEETGLSSIMVAKDGGRAVAVYRGASAFLTVEDIVFEKLDTKWLHISALAGRMQMVKALVDYAVVKGIKVAWNPGKKECEMLREDVSMREEVLAKVEVLLVNREEAEILTGVEYLVDSVWQQNILIGGPRVVVVTNGKNGGKVWTEGRCIDYLPVMVEAVEETGAGDAFGSGMVAALISDRSVEEAIEWGKKQAASVVEQIGPKRGLLRLEQIA